MIPKRVTIIPTFTDVDRLQSIFRVNINSTVVTKPNHQVIYIENRWERFVAADIWNMSVDELVDFMNYAKLVHGEGLSFISPSSFALSLYKRKYATDFQHIVLPLGDYRARLSRDALYGGRCEVYEFGKRKLYQYDINSSYPFAALHLQFPVVKSIYYNHYPTVAQIMSNEGISKVVFSQEGIIPILPIRKDGRIYYGVGERLVGTYTHTELRYALEHGVTVLAVLKQFIAETVERDNPFTAFIEDCYKWRQSSGLKLYKRFMNGLFGRLSVQGDTLLRFKPCYSKGVLRATPRKSKDYFGVACTAETMYAPSSSNCLWAAMVLASARTRLHQYCKYAHYVDTDCFMSPCPIDVPVSDNIGDFKRKYATYDIRGAKQYLLDDGQSVELRLKGIATQYRKLADFYAARYTQERLRLNDNTTIPHTLPVMA